MKLYNVFYFDKKDRKYNLIVPEIIIESTHNRLLKEGFTNITFEAVQ